MTTRCGCMKRFYSRSISVAIVCDLRFYRRQQGQCSREGLMRGFFYGVGATVLVFGLAAAWLWFRDPASVGEFVASQTTNAKDQDKTSFFGKQKRGKIHVKYGELRWENEQGEQCRKTIEFTNLTEYRFTHDGYLEHWPGVSETGSISSDQIKRMGRLSFSLPAMQVYSDDLFWDRRTYKRVECDDDVKDIRMTTTRCELENHTEHQCMNALEIDKSIKYFGLRVN